jgi:hypothetical protein
VIASTVLDYAYKHESNANVRERILLVRRISSDGEDIVLVSKEELHRSRAGRTNGSKDLRKRVWKD